jgi:hypothetical protein
MRSPMAHHFPVGYNPLPRGKVRENVNELQCEKRLEIS